MTEIPEHLLNRSKARRAEAPSDASGDSAPSSTPAVATPATPAKATEAPAPKPVVLRGFFETSSVILEALSKPLRYFFEKPRRTPEETSKQTQRMCGDGVKDPLRCAEVDMSCRRQEASPTSWV